MKSISRSRRQGKALPAQQPNDLPKHTVIIDKSFPADDQYRKDWTQLEKELMKIGGKGVVHGAFEGNLPQLLSEGLFYDPIVNMQVGWPNDPCYNAYYLQSRNPEHVQVVRGYALSGDGFWKSHVWATFGNWVIETWEGHTGYFGFRPMKPINKRHRAAKPKPA